MILVDYRGILKEKYERQNSIEALKLSANGFAAHIGEMSPGCRSCFTEEGCRHSVFIGDRCPFNCPMCFYNTLDPDAEEDVSETLNEIKSYYYSKLFDDLYKPANIAFNAHGEPFLYIDKYLETSQIIKDVESKNNISIHKRIYTTGVIYSKEIANKLEEIGIEEIRFHISASDFSEQVYDNMRQAKKDGFRITVEEPAWPLHKEKLIASLPILEEIGIDHFNMDEIDLTPSNIKSVNDIYPEGRMYKNLNYHLYDEGLVYDIMEEVVKNNYSFSVLDCNSDVVKSRTILNRDIVGFDVNDFKDIIKSIVKGEEN